MQKKTLLSASVILFFLSPYLLLLVYFLINGYELNFPNQLGEVLQFTKWEAFYSAIASIVIGVIGGFGLIAFQESRLKKVLSLVILIPSAVPVLFVILAVLNLIPTLSGLTGIVFVHTIINAGLVAVVFEKLLKSRAGTYLELARVEGASIRQLLLRVVFPLVQWEVIVLFLAVFAFCFSSFAVPMLVGGSRARTVEVLIYELIRVDGAWAQALFASFVQTAIVIAMSLFIAREAPSIIRREVNIRFLGFKGLIVFALAPSVLVLAGLCANVVSGFSQLFGEISLETLSELTFNSILISFGTAFLCLLGLIGLAVIRPSGDLRKFILGFVAPSSILTGLAVLIFWRDTGFATLLKIMIGLSFVFLPILYRLGWDAKINSIRSQVLTAETLGASQWQIFRNICWPQMSPTAASLVALAGFWAWGEFALSKMVSERTVSVALLVQSMMGSYRLNSAAALVWLMLLASGITYFIIWGIVYVSGRKSTH